MSCENLVGIKNILISFVHCDTGQEVRNLSHELAAEELPRVRTSEHRSEKLPGGYTRRHLSSPRIEMKIIRDLRIPLRWYQGDASMTVQLEYENGLVYTGTAGTVDGEELSDTHEINLMVVHKRISELLPPGAFASAA